MALNRSVARARSGRSLVVSVVVPLALLTVAITIGVALIATGAGRRAADKELDARAATVKKAWDGAGRPARKADLARLGRRLNADLSVERGSRPQPAATSGKVRSYEFATRQRRTLRVGLPVAQSA